MRSWEQQELEGRRDKRRWSGRGLTAGFSWVGRRGDSEFPLATAEALQESDTVQPSALGFHLPVRKGPSKAEPLHMPSQLTWPI